MIDLSHSSSVYQTRYRFPVGFVWTYPAAAWGALCEAIPWHALGVSTALLVVLWLKLGSDLGGALGIGACLLLTTVQMLCTKDVVIGSNIIRRRGLIGFRKTTIPLASVRGGRVEYPTDDRSFGDVVLETSDGLQRFRAVAAPEAVLAKLLTLSAPVEQKPLAKRGR